jgi:hypothetical protein
MPAFAFLWTGEIVEHLAEHGLSQDDFEHVVCNPTSKGFSRSSGLPCIWGHSEDGRHVIAVYEEIDDDTILPVTACEVPEPN